MTKLMNPAIQARSNPPPPALILDAEQKSSLAAIRSLGARGIPVIAGSHHSTAMGLYSRYVHRRFRYPSPLRDRDNFVACILREAEAAGHPVLLAFSDSTLLPLADFPRGQQNWRWPLAPGNDCFQLAFDKGRTLELAESIGLGAPTTYNGTNRSGLTEFLRRHTFPLVVKPRHSVSWRHGTQGQVGVHLSPQFATSRQELDSSCDAILAQTGEFPLVQEYVRGEQASIQFLCDRGTVVAACANRRLRSSHPTGGPGVLKETVPLSYRGMADRARTLVAAVNWSGPIMVEFKIDDTTQIPMLMEINGRFWGSLPLAVLAGVDFPYLYYRLALGIEVAPTLAYSERVVSRHFIGDLRHLCSVLFRSDSMRPLTYPKRWRAVRDFLELPRDCKSDVVDFHDPAPALAEIVDTGTRLVSRFLP